MCKINYIISEEEIEKIEESDIFYDILLGKTIEIEELSLEELIELEEDSYDSLKTDYSQIHKHYSTFEE